MQTEYILKKADETVSAFDSRDPFFVAKQTGASVNFKDIGSLRGAYFGTMPIPAIVINENSDEQMKKIICAHELGHHLLHKGSIQSCENSIYDSGILEREANVFAAAFLIDKGIALQLLKTGLSVSQTASVMETDVNLLLALLNTLKLTDSPDSSFLK